MATVISGPGNISVSATGALSGQLLNAISAALSNAQTVTGSLGSIPGAPSSGGALFLAPTTSGASGNVAIPTGYRAVLFNNDGATAPGAGVALTNTDSTTAFAGDNLSLLGAAGSVMGSGTVGGNINDSTAGAVIALNASGSSVAGYNVTAAGAGDAIEMDSGANSVSATGGGDTFKVTGGSNTVTGGGNDTVSLVGSTIGGATTVNAGAGGDLVFGGQGQRLNFAGGANASTVFGVGNEVLNSGSGALYYADFNQASSGGEAWISNNSTVNAFWGPTEIGVVVGSGSGNYYAAGSASVFAYLTPGVSSAPGTSNFYGGNVATTVIGNSNQNVNLIGTKPSEAMLQGSNASLNLQLAGGSDTVLAYDPLSTGTETLTGSNAGHDIFAYINLGAQSVQGNITIQNWQATDTFYLVNGFSAADVNNANAALGAGGSGSFTLSDGTKFTFVGAHPSSVATL
jgi:hypothetical protein